MVLVQAALTVLMLTAAGQAVLLDFDRDTCPPCRAMDPTMQALVAKGYPVRRVNVEREPAVAAQYGVTGTPCFVMTVDGREIDRVVGGTSFSRLERMCKTGLAQTQGPPAAQLPQAVAGPVPPAAAVPAGASPTAFPLPSAKAADSWPAMAISPPRSGQPAAADDGLIAASVRLRIEDPTGHSCGSGTIIDARGGKALILTCGHIFRDSQGKGRIEVDLFGPYAGQRVPGELIDYDTDRDIGLVCIRAPAPVATAKVAPAGFRIGHGEPVISVGCNNGGLPTAVHSRVTSVDKFLGPPNIQVAGQPVEGRSGGGLFSDDGLVIGVCNAADPSDREGFFAALPSIHALLDKAGLSFAYKGTGDNAVAQAAAVPRGMLVPVESPPLSKQTLVPTGATGNSALPAFSAPAAGGEDARLSRDEQAALEEIRRRLHDGAEVICVVRNRQNPQANSEVIVLDRVSSGFVRQLAAEAPTQDPRHLTSLEVPRGREAAVGAPPVPAAAPPAQVIPPAQNPPLRF